MYEFVLWYVSDRKWPRNPGSLSEPMFCSFSGNSKRGFHYSHNSVLKYNFREIICLVK